MADITKEELKKEITAILKDADLTTMSAKKVRQQVEEKLDCDLSVRKKEIDDIVMQCLKDTGKKGGNKKNGKGDDDEDEEEEDEEEEEEEEDEEDEEEEKPKRSAKKPPQKRKKESSEESGSDADDKEDSEEEYSPSKKAKGKPKGKPAGKGRKKKGSDSDSDEDWGKGRKGGGGGGGGGGAAPKKGGGKRGGGGYTKVCTLSAELAAVVGAEQMARHEVVKKIWSIIKEKNLYDPKNKQFAICNDELLKVFGVKRFRTFGMMKFLKNHFVD